MIFNIFTWFQIFNMLNARKCNGEPNFLADISGSKMYLLVWIGILIMQFVLVEVLGRVSFGVVSTLPLNSTQWGISLLFGACSLIWNFIILRIPVPICKFQVYIPFIMCGRHLNMFTIDTNTQEISLDNAHHFSRDAIEGGKNKGAQD